VSWIVGSYRVLLKGVTMQQALPRLASAGEGARFDR
jgi:hypothetical protein